MFNDKKNEAVCMFGRGVYGGNVPFYIVKKFLCAKNILNKLCPV